MSNIYITTPALPIHYLYIRLLHFEEDKNKKMKIKITNCMQLPLTDRWENRFGLFRSFSFFRIQFRYAFRMIVSHRIHQFSRINLTFGERCRNRNRLCAPFHLTEFASFRFDPIYYYFFFLVLNVFHHSFLNEPYIFVCTYCCAFYRLVFMSFIFRFDASSE